MAVTETGYQNYEMYNVTNTQEDAHLEQVPLSPETTSTRVVASFQADDGARSLVLEGNFNITGNTMADVHGSMTSITMYRDGSVFFSDAFSNGADFQAWVADYNYNLSLLNGNDTFTGSATQAINDAVQTLAGNDVFTGYGDTNGQNPYGGGDHFYGGSGIDTAIYRGNMNQYSISTDVNVPDARTNYNSGNTGDMVTDLVSNRDGTDRLVDVERLEFADTMVGLDVGVGGHTGEIYRLYLTALDRNPEDDPTGCGFWIHQRDQGTSLDSIVNGFLTSPEFVSRFGGTTNTNESFVNLLYENMLGRSGQGDPGYDFWVNVLNTGAADRAQVVVGFMESPENVAAVAPIIGNTPTYQEWIG